MFFIFLFALNALWGDQMEPLAQKKCVPCESGGLPLKGDILVTLYDQLESGWNIIDEHHLKKVYHFKDFRQALMFTNEVGEIAEIEGHHPDLYLAWGVVKVMIWTHKINGLTESDFILAAKCDRIYERLSRP